MARTNAMPNILKVFLFNLTENVVFDFIFPKRISLPEMSFSFLIAVRLESALPFIMSLSRQ